MGYWDDDAFNDKHADEWRADAYYDRYGWPDAEDEIDYNLESSVTSLLDAFGTASDYFVDVVDFSTVIDDYLLPLYQQLTGKEYRFGDADPNQSDVESAKRILDILPELAEDIESNLDSAPHFSEDRYLSDLLDEVREGEAEMRHIIAAGGLD